MFGYFWSVENIQVSLKYDRNNRYFTWRPATFRIVSRWILLGMRNFSDKFVEKIWTHILWSITLFRKSYRLWDRVEKYGSAGQATNDSIMQSIHSAYRLINTTDTHSEYVILIAFPLLQYLRERASILRYTWIACLVINWRGLERSFCYFLRLNHSNNSKL